MLLVTVSPNLKTAKTNELKTLIDKGRQRANSVHIINS